MQANAAPVRAAASALPERLSSRDAQEVWARAAELQANTGLIVRPSSFPAHRESGDAETRGYDMTVIRESAADAGIDLKYVDRALAERSQAPYAVTRGEAMERKPGMFAGAHTRIEFEGSIEGELTQDGFEDIADEARRALGEVVQISAVGRTLTITTASSGGGRRSSTPRFLQITVTSRNGRTTVHGFENLQQLAGAMFGGLMGGVGAGGGGMIMGLVMGATQNPAIAFPIWGSTIVGAYVAARMLFWRKSGQRAEELRKLVERVLAKARDNVR
jgi:serine/threonine-protein kinase